MPKLTPKRTKSLKVASFCRFSGYFCTISGKLQKLESSKLSTTNELAAKKAFVADNLALFCLKTFQDDPNLSKNRKIPKLRKLYASFVKF